MKKVLSSCKMFIGFLGKLFNLDRFDFKTFKKRLAFNMLEVTISLITIACIASAFVPVITKKVTHSSLAIRQTTETITDCTEITVDGVKLDSNCKVCYPEKCMVCNKSCAGNQAKRVKTCECKDCADRKCVNVNADGNEVTTDQTNVCKKDKVCIKCSDPDVSSRNCDRCKGGYYLRTTDYMCKQCLPGHRCPEPTSPCPDPCKTFFGRNASSGTPSIKYSQWSNAGSTVCNLPCPSGYYCHTEAQNPKFDGSCVNKRIKEQCRYGHYCISGLEQEMCPMGKYQDERGKASCKNCPAETWHPNATQTSFDSVNDDDKYVYSNDANRYSLDEKYRYSSACTAALCGDNANCINGVRTRCSGKQFATKGENIKDDSGNNFPQHTCQNCTKGYCCTRGFRHKCNKGTYAASTMNCVLTEDNSPSSSKNGDRDKPADCTYCPPGKYQDTQTQSSCKNCPAGWWTCAADGVRHESGNYNQASKRACLKKINGLTTDKTNGCGHKCEKGYYCPGDGTKRLCTKGHYCPEGSSKMTDCPCGYKCPNDGMWTPTACPCGQYQPNKTQTACLNVPKGNYQDGTGKCDYKAVPCGHYQPNEGKCDYIQCPVGYYQDETAKTSCKIVPCGHYQDVKAQCSYKACPCGQYQNEQGKTSCKAVPCGNYQSSTGKCNYDACPAGKYQKSTSKCGCDTTPCGNYNNTTGQCNPLACPLCKWQDATGQTGCKESGKGYYVSSTGQCGRTVCPKGRYCPASCNSGATCCPCGQYTDATTQSGCKSCAAGTYQPSTCQTSCPKVPAKYYQDATGKCDYKVCPAGKYCPEGTANPITCPAGKYCPQGSSAPINCGKGKYSAAGASSCTTCPAGKYCPSDTTSTPTDCPCGNYCPAGASGPTACGAGKYSGVRTTAASGCSSCPAGKYCPSATTCTPSNCPCGQYSTGGASGCSSCPPGQYQNETGKTSCKSVPAGYYQNGWGQCGYGTCPCGQYSTGGASGCSSCPPGQYQNAAGQSGCKPVPAGYYQNGWGQCGYAACPPGSYSTGGASGCPGCPAGTYAPNASSSGCATCPVGKYCPGSTSSPSTCPCGYYCPAGSGGPSICGAGTYSAAGSDRCAACPAGQYQDAAGQCGCKCCGAGSYSGAGWTGCTSASPGYYVPGACSSGQNACPPGQYSEGWGWTGCWSCPPGGYSPDWGWSGCWGCPAGMYSPDWGWSGCWGCPGGTWSDGWASGCYSVCGGSKMMQVSVNGAYTLCVTKFNPADGGIDLPWAAAGVQWTQEGNSGSVCPANTGCCWQGTTGTGADLPAGASYGGSNRTVCNYQAAVNICANLNVDGVTGWRLPSCDEQHAMYYAMGPGNLEYCSNHGSQSNHVKCLNTSGCYGAAKSCDHNTESCPGTHFLSEKGCQAYKLWCSDGSAFEIQRDNEIYTVSSGKKMGNGRAAISVRCVKNL